jgi:hypothetical protein
MVRGLRPVSVAASVTVTCLAMSVSLVAVLLVRVDLPDVLLA